MIGVGIIGYGYWGPNIVRNFSEIPGVQLIGICDVNIKLKDSIQARYPSIAFSSDPKDLITNPKVDAVAIVTPVATHFDLGMMALRAGKDVFIEKPLTTSSGDSKKLIEEAKKRKLILMVDHTFVYTSAVRKIKEIVSSDDFGDVYYYDSIRVNLGLFQHDVNVVWDLAVHDLAIINYILPAKPVAVSATGISNIPGQPENIAYLTLFFNEPIIAHIHVNWLAPAKVRRTLVGGSKRMIIYDDLEPSEKVKVYDKGIIRKTESEQSIHKMLIGYRTGDMWAPKIDEKEALKEELTHFIKCVQNRSKPITDGEEGLAVVNTLEAASLSIAKMGEITKIKE